MSRRYLRFCLCVPPDRHEHGARGRFRKKESAVEPSELARRSDLIGKKVALDDHVRYYVQADGQRAG